MDSHYYYVLPTIWGIKVDSVRPSKRHPGNATVPGSLYATQKPVSMLAKRLDRADFHTDIDYPSTGRDLPTGGVYDQGHSDLAAASLPLEQIRVLGPFGGL